MHNDGGPSPPRSVLSVVYLMAVLREGQICHATELELMIHQAEGAIALHCPSLLPPLSLTLSLSLPLLLDLNILMLQILIWDYSNTLVIILQAMEIDLHTQYSMFCCQLECIFTDGYAVVVVGLPLDRVLVCRGGGGPRSEKRLKKGREGKRKNMAFRSVLYVKEVICIVLQLLCCLSKPASSHFNCISPTSAHRYLRLYRGSGQKEKSDARLSYST